MLEKNSCRTCLSRAVFCLTVCLCSASTAASAAPYISPYGYTMNVPTGWHAKPHLGDGDDVTVLLNQRVAVRGRMTTPGLTIQHRPVEREFVAANLGAFNAIVLSTIRQRFSDLKVLSQTPSTLGGVRGLDCVFVASINGVPARFHEVLIARHGFVFTFISICPEPLYPKYAAAISQMFASIRWKS